MTRKEFLAKCREIAETVPMAELIPTADATEGSPAADAQEAAPSANWPGCLIERALGWGGWGSYEHASILSGCDPDVLLDLARHSDSQNKDAILAFIRDLEAM